MSNASAATSPAWSAGHEPLLIRRAAVLGAGTMGSRIAAHLANAGIPALLLDLAAESKTEPRSRLAMAGIEALARSKPAALFDSSQATLITPGNFDDDLSKLSDCDWVIEAVTENLEIKTALLSRVAPHLASHALLTTNTSGLPIGRIAAAIPGLRERFFGTHFFNPPRYMRLVEVIATPQSDPAAVAAFAAFADRILGKQVVFANDTPNFIANHIGIGVTFTAANLMLEGGFAIEEVDALTGPVLGWPRTGTFRLADLVGIDVLAHVASNSPQSMKAGPFSALLAEMVKRGWLGDKSGQGFYRKVRDPGGEEQRLVLDPATFEYRPLVKPNLPTLEMARTAESLPVRLRVLLKSDPASDLVASFLWPLLISLWNDAADSIGKVTADAPSIDAAMRAGFNWEMGPFQMWDAASVPSSVTRMTALGARINPRVQALLASGETSWYGDDGRTCFQPATGRREPVAAVRGHARVADYRRNQKLVRGNAGASLIDLGDGIACIELHSLKNAIGGDVLALISAVLKPSSTAVRDFAGFVISGDRENFSVGANLTQILLLAQDAEWEELAAVIHAFQQMTAAVKFCPRPVVVAPFGLTLGGGAEICLHAARRQPCAETYMGLVETGVGLIPAGGGTKEMLLRAVDAAHAVAPSQACERNSGLAARFVLSAELAAALRSRFELIAMAKVSTSASEARCMGLLSSVDRITMNRSRLLLDAKAQVAALAEAGYTAPQPRTLIPAPGTAALATFETGIYLMGEAGYASEHDQKVARWAAYVLAGGRVTPGTPVSEEYLLDLEREAFLSLCGEPKTQERIAHTLKTGKPLRN